ncbi:MAG: hypothetical protein ACOC7V_11240, partial [Spirochaetota bacterium]
RENEIQVWRPYSFPFGRYPLILAAPRGETIASLSSRPLIRIATPLPNLTREVFASRGMAVNVVPVGDSVTACLLGLADGFVDRLVDPEVLGPEGEDRCRSPRRRIGPSRGHPTARRRGSRAVIRRVVLRDEARRSDEEQDRTECEHRETELSLCHRF